MDVAQTGLPQPQKQLLAYSSVNKEFHIEGEIVDISMCIIMSISNLRRSINQSITLSCL